MAEWASSRLVTTSWVSRAVSAYSVKCRDSTRDQPAVEPTPPWAHDRVIAPRARARQTDEGRFMVGRVGVAPRDVQDAARAARHRGGGLPRRTTLYARLDHVRTNLDAALPGRARPPRHLRPPAPPPVRRRQLRGRGGRRRPLPGVRAGPPRRRRRWRRRSSPRAARRRRQDARTTTSSDSADGAQASGRDAGAGEGGLQSVARAVPRRHPAWACWGPTGAARSAAGGRRTAGPELTVPSVAVIGASSARHKYGNRAVRAYLRQGWTVYPVNPNEADRRGAGHVRPHHRHPRPGGSRQPVRAARRWARRCWRASRTRA